MRNTRLQIAIVFLLSFNPLLSFSQKVITVDFKGKTAPSLVDVKGITEGEYYQVVINNINLNLYKVSLQTKDSILIPPQKTPDFSLLGTSALTGVINGITSLSGLSLLVPPPPPPSPTFAPGVHIKTKGTAVIIGIPVDKNNEIRGRMNKEKGYLDQFKVEMLRIKTDIDNVGYNAVYYQLKAKTEFAEGPTYTGLNAVAPGFDVAATITTVKATRIDIGTLRAGVKAKNASYIAFSDVEPYKTIISKDEELKARDADIKDRYVKLAAAVDAADSLVNPVKINDLLTSVIYQQNNESYQYKSMPVQFRNDQAQVSLNITPANANIPLQSYSMPFVFPVRKKQYVGVAVSFYASTLHSDAYSVLSYKKDTSLVDSIVKETPGSGEFGMSALLHFGTKIYKDNVGAHFSFGPGISVSNTLRPRLLLGGGFTLGKKHMATVDFGCITGYVDRLSNALNVNTVYADVPSSPVVSVLRVGGFMSIGYLYKF